MIRYPAIDPVAFHLGSFPVHWYGLMYLLSFMSVWGLARYRAAQRGGVWTADAVADLIFYGALGVIVGGRVGYVLFYDFSGLLQDPLMLFRVWQGGMSFHGGFLGVLAAMAWYARKLNVSLWDVMDFVAPLAPVGLAMGRLGNFINGELWGRVSTAPWAMVFPGAGPLPRHPSQLYEFFFEGVVLFALLWWYSSRPRPRFAVSALFLIGYGVMRFSMEFFRQPDVQIGFVAWGWLTEGQLLCIPMVVIGVLAMAIIIKRA